MRSTWTLLTLVFAASGIANIAAGQEPPSGVACGDTITVDTTLDRDLSGCANNGIIIGADGVTLDLNGHTIAGDGTAIENCPRGTPCDIGVLSDDHHDVTIRNGTVRGFGVGVNLARARDGAVLGMSSSHNQYFGFVFSRSTRSLIRDSSGSDNPAPDGDGLGVFASDHIRIIGNSFLRNGQLGMHLADSERNLITRNRVVRNSDFGIFLEADRNRVLTNRAVGNGEAGIIVGPGSRNVIARNRVYRGGEGIAIEKGLANAVTGNLVVGVQRSGIRLGIDDPAIGSTRTVVRRNRVTRSGGDGFQVAKSDRGSLLQLNVARRSGDHGFDIQSPSARLTRNLSIGSAGNAFETAPGVVNRG